MLFSWAFIIITSRSEGIFYLKNSHILNIFYIVQLQQKDVVSHMQMSSHAFCFTLRTDFVYRNKDRGRLTRRISAHPTDARDVVSHTTDVGSRKSTLIFLLHELYHNLTRSCVEKKNGCYVTWNCCFTFPVHLSNHFFFLNF